MKDRRIFTDERESLTFVDWLCIIGWAVIVAAMLVYGGT